MDTNDNNPAASDGNLPKVKSEKELLKEKQKQEKLEKFKAKQEKLKQKQDQQDNKGGEVQVRFIVMNGEWKETFDSVSPV
jgi:hypothetical protein